MSSYPNIQSIMDQAFATWDTHRYPTFESFVQSLPPQQAAAVVLGKLNYQVHNGGFYQWLDNQYAQGFAGAHLLAVLTDMEARLPHSTIATQVKDLVTKALTVREVVVEAQGYWEDDINGSGNQVWVSDELTDADLDSLDDVFCGDIGERSYCAAVAAYLWLYEPRAVGGPSTGPISGPIALA